MGYLVVEGSGLREVIDIKGVMAEKLIDEALSIAKEIDGEEHRRAWAFAEIALALASIGKVDEAKKLVNEALTMTKEAHAQLAGTIWEAPSGYAWAYAKIALALASIGKVDEAKKLVNEAFNALKETPQEDACGRAWAFTSIAPVLTFIGKVDEALSIAKETECESCRAWAFAEIALALASIGKVDEAKKLVNEALTMTKETEYDCCIAWAYAKIASVLAQYRVLASLALEWPDVLLPNLAQELSATLSVRSVGSSFNELLVVFSGQEGSVKVEPGHISFFPLKPGSTIKRHVKITPLRLGQVPLGIRIESPGLSLKRAITLKVAPISLKLLAPSGEIVEGGRFPVPFEVELSSRVEITALEIAYEREALRLLKVPDLKGAAGPGKLRGSIIFKALRPGKFRIGPLVVRTPDYEVPSEPLTVHVRPARPELVIDFVAPSRVRPGEELRLTAKVRCVRGKALSVVPSFEPGDAWAPLLVQEEAIGDMSPGEEATLEFVLIALREGRFSPGKLVLSYSDLEGKEHRLEQEAPEITVSRIQRPVAPRERRRPAKAEERPVSIPLKPRRIVALPLSIKLAPISPKPLEEELALRLGRVEFWDAEALGPMPEEPSVELKGLIGSGGLSIVYLGSIAGREVAVKVPLFPRPWRTLERGEQEALLAEAELMTKLKHPNIVAVLAYGTSPWAWVALELMEGGSLRVILDQHYPSGLPIREAVLMGIQLADALDYIHHYGIVHRDIKPGNVLFTADGVPKLADLGLAKLMMRSSRGGEVKGTPAYLAPEQVDPDAYGEVDWRTDIWQLSLTLYEALTGRNPFMAPSPVEIQARVVSVQPKKPSDIRPDVPKSLDEVLLTGLAKEKEDRYETAEGFRRALLAVLEEKLSHG